MAHQTRIPMKKPHTEFTPERKQVYLETLRTTGVFYLAARNAGVSPEIAQAHRRIDKVFAEMVNAAKQEHVDSLVLEANRRAVEGVPEPIVGGKDRDTVVAHVQRYSDNLLQTLLRAGRPEFGPAGVAGAEGAAQGGGGSGLLIVPAAPHTISDWQDLYGEKAAASIHHSSNQGDLL